MTRTRPSWTRTPKDKDKDKDLTPKDQDKDKDLKKVLKESLRTRTRTRINIPGYWPTFMFSYEPLTTSGVAYTLSLHIYFTPLHSSFTLTWKHCSLVNPIIHSFRIFIQRPFTKPTQKRSQSS